MLNEPDGKTGFPFLTFSVSFNAESRTRGTIKQKHTFIPMRSSFYFFFILSWKFLITFCLVLVTCTPTTNKSKEAQNTLSQKLATTPANKITIRSFFSRKFYLGTIDLKRPFNRSSASVLPPSSRSFAANSSLSFLTSNKSTQRKRYRRFSMTLHIISNKVAESGLRERRKRATRIDIW